MIMMTQATLGTKVFSLDRFPLDQINRSLQAWDSADEYLIDYVNEHHPESEHILILNDSFGALSCYFISQGKQCTTVSDSYIADQATLHNIEQNQLEKTLLNQLNSLSTIEGEFDLVLIKLPKNLGYLAHQLASISQSVRLKTPVIAAGKTKDIHNSTSVNFEKFIGPTKTSLAVKKSRLVISNLIKTAQPSPYPIEWPLEKTTFSIFNHANVFSRDSLDIGARFFANYLPHGQKPLDVVDLGCGNGVIGLQTLQTLASAKLTFIDESFMAIASAKLNVEKNLAEKIEQCQFVQGDCLSDLATQSQDLILCNPPFHQLQAVTDHIARQMFEDSHRVLRSGGELRIVGNRHLDYHEQLKHLFGNCRLLGSNKKFVVLSAKKR
ncbi:16S rRNA (guanine1207-N2)-methyltransferase [Pseudoalteromonas tunicata]|uniref:Ribosomal RNA large subunit methyltransferase G n=2 Tax=Pseudoalteromonas tunicata TaxID=314281 RepID=A4C6S8_9GAMM|nr:16S rRNA (guanine1207-N2)-methyltransferase [Pseudoalteromonas tunicata]EAR29682.1 Putative ribosomal RNA small subunit methyltransferase D [Pseudoalteromonas tunicata D2]